jgi:hypothetical protein
MLIQPLPDLFGAIGGFIPAFEDGGKGRQGEVVD